MPTDGSEQSHDVRYEWCDGCSGLFNPDSLETVEMKYGDKETLCQRCIGQSREMIDR